MYSITELSKTFIISKFNCQSKDPCGEEEDDASMLTLALYFHSKGTGFF